MKTLAFFSVLGAILCAFALLIISALTGNMSNSILPFILMIMYLSFSFIYVRTRRRMDKKKRDEAIERERVLLVATNNLLIELFSKVRVYEKGGLLAFCVGSPYIREIYVAYQSYIKAGGSRNKLPAELIHLLDMMPLPKTP